MLRGARVTAGAMESFCPIPVSRLKLLKAAGEARQATEVPRRQEADKAAAAQEQAHALRWELDNAQA